MKIDGELEAQGKEDAQVVCTDTMGKTVIDLHRDIVGFYLLSITLQLKLVCALCFLGTCPHSIMVHTNAWQTSALSYVFVL